MPRDLIERHRSLRILISLLATLIAIFLASLIWNTLMVLGDVILLFFLAWVIAFILEPVSIILQKRGLPRTLAVSIIYLALLIVVSGAIVLAIPSIEEEVRLLTNEITTALSPGNLNTLNGNIVQTLRHVGFSQKDAQNVVNSISGQIPSWTTNAANNAVDVTTTLFTSVLGLLFNAFLVMIISFYMMLDGDRLVESFVVKLPPSWQPDVRLFQRNVEQIFGGFFRAQLTIGAIYGLFTWLTLVALGQANGLLVAALSGAIMLIPFIGPFFAIVPPVLLVLLQSPTPDIARNVIIMLILQFVAQQIVMQLIAPRVFGTQMGIHPLLLFAALLIGAKVGGVWGAFFAGPIAAVAYATVQVYYQRFSERSPLFQPAAATAAETDDALRLPSLADQKPLAREAVARRSGGPSLVD